MVLEVCHAAVTLSGRNVLRDVELAIPRGAIHAIIGRNGCGKSTLLRAIAGLVPLAAGTMVYDHALLEGPPSRRRQMGIAYLPQGKNTFDALTVEDHLRLAHDLDTGGAHDDPVVVFPRLRALEGRRARQLSGGERQMLALASTCFGSARLLLLDEPTVALATDLATALLNHLRRKCDEQRTTVLLVEQHVATVSGIADACFALDDGTLTRLSHQGSSDKPEVLNSATATQT